MVLIAVIPGLIAFLAARWRGAGIAAAALVAMVVFTLVLIGLLWFYGSGYMTGTEMTF